MQRPAPTFVVRSMLSDSERRLSTVPWTVLDGLGPVLDAPLQRVLEGEAAERVLDQTLRANRSFTPEQRQVCAESLFGVGLWRRRLSGSPLQRLAQLAQLGGCADAFSRLGVVAVAAPASSSWRERFSFPDWIADRFDTRFGSEAAVLADVLNRPGPVTLRAKTNRSELADRLRAVGVETVPARWAPNALHVTTPRPNLLGLGAEFLGAFEVQDEGSQLLGALLDVRAGDEVLDLCAGAGGKSLQLAARAGPTGRVHATDLDLPKLERLRSRASKAGARVLIHGARAPESLRVPHVLIDAPCSELGTLRRGPDLRWRLRESSVREFALVQRELIAAGLRHLAPGGRLVYATCTMTPEENEDVVTHALATGLTLVRPAISAELLDARGCLSLSPHRHGTDGFFAAVFER
ncbi:MAG: RsmB/NOP family class I SAM-dependent RNA methyltransferase [Archangium sp.]